jgi:hypothetical protein
VHELRARLARWAISRRDSDGRHGIVDRLGANPEDIITVAFRTFRALRLLQDALAGAPPEAARDTGDGRSQEAPAPPSATHTNRSTSRVV